MMTSGGSWIRDVYTSRMRLEEMCSALCPLLTAYMFSGPPGTQVLLKRRGSAGEGLCTIGRTPSISMEGWSPNEVESGGGEL